MKTKLSSLMRTTQFNPDLMHNPEETHGKINEMIQDCLKEIPTKRVRINKYNIKRSPRITQGLLNSIRRRDMLYKQLIKTKEKK